jgi:subtilisin family serine protease
MKRYAPVSLIVLIGLLAACGGQTPTSRPQDPGYLLTVQLGPDDSQTTIIQRYGGEVLTWHPDGGFANLKIGSVEAESMQSQGVLPQGVMALSVNGPTRAPELSAWGMPAWSGGWNAWSGGWNAWGGGWNTWGGGTTDLPDLPTEIRSKLSSIKLPQAQALAKNFGSGAKVAVIDTGIDLVHPAFTGRLAPAAEWKDFVGGDANPQEVAGGSGYGHGTGVASIILQIAPRATILPIRVLGSNGVGDVDNVILAIDWAVQKGAKIINLSLGTDADVPALKAEVEYAASQGVYVVASAGNQNGALSYPAAYAKSPNYGKYILSVGSISLSNLLSTFTNRGSTLEFLAPGENLYGAYPGNQTAYFSGTSFAAPQIAGGLALSMKETASTNQGNLETYLFNSGATVDTYKRLDLPGLLRQLPDFQPRKALLIASSTTLNTSDSWVKARLESLGYTVRVKDDNFTQIEDTNGMDLFLISSSVNESDVSSEFLDARVPLVTWEANLYKDMKMTNSNSGDFGFDSNLTQVRIAGSSHPLAAGKSGDLAVYAANAKVGWGKPGTGAVKVGTLISSSTKVAIFGYDKNAAMIGMNAPARRVGLYLSDSSTSVNETGWGLLEAAVTWAISGN